MSVIARILRAQLEYHMAGVDCHGISPEIVFWITYLLRYLPVFQLLFLTQLLPTDFSHTQIKCWNKVSEAAWLTSLIG